MKDERYYTYREAGRALGVDGKTVARWAQLADMTPLRDNLDQRRRLLSEDQVEQLRQLRGRPHSGAAARDPQTAEGVAVGHAVIASPDQRIAALEIEVSLLRQQVMSLQSTLPAIVESVASATEALATLAHHVASTDGGAEALNGTQQPNVSPSRGAKSGHQFETSGGEYHDADRDDRPLAGARKSDE